MPVEKRTRRNLIRERDEVSLNSRDMNFLLEDVDRSAYEKALQYIQPLSELEDVFEKLPATKRAIREVINRVNAAVASDPDPILNALGLSNDQKELVDSCTSAEVLKLSLLNAFDAVRQLLITDFARNPKIYEDEAIELRVIPSARSRGTADVREPKRVPYSTVESLADYTVHWQDGRNMIVGPDIGGRLYNLSWTLPRTTATINMRNVPAGKIYLVSREEGDPAPVSPLKKRDILGIPLTPRGSLDKTLDFLSTDTTRDKTFDLPAVVDRNFRIPAPAMGFVESIYRSIRARPPIQPPNLTASDLSNELKDLTLAEFRTYFRALVEKTTTATGDITTYDVADTLFLGGLAWVSGILGITSAPPSAPASTAPGPGGGPAPGPGSSGPGGGPPSGGGDRRHSLNNILSDPSIVTGATPAERAANLRALRSAVNQEELRRALNTLTVGTVVFTEGVVDRWNELAGIKEQK